MRRTVISLVLFLMSLHVGAQFFDPDGQIWVGIRGSVNWSSIKVKQEFSVVEGGAAEPKQYKNITPRGAGIGMILTYEVNDYLSVSLQPHYNQVVFGYQSNYTWTTKAGTSNLENKFDNRLDFLNFPLLFRFEFPLKSRKRWTRGLGSGQKGSFTPFFEFGAQYGRLISANKFVESSLIENEVMNFSTTSLADTYDLLNHDQYSLLFGAGLSYDIGGSFRIALSGTYSMGLVNNANGSTRFTNDVLTEQYYDAFDDFTWRNIDVELHLLFPIKFIMSGNFRAL